MNHMPTSYLEYIDPKSKLAKWIWSPVVFLRSMLFLAYIGLIYCAVIAFLAGVPVFRLTTPDGYTAVWAVLLGLSAVVSAAASITDQWQVVEKWSSLVVTGLFAAYAGGLNGVGFTEGDLDRQFAGGVALILWIILACRYVYLAAQTGKRKRVRTRNK